MKNLKISTTLFLFFSLFLTLACTDNTNIEDQVNEKALSDIIPTPVSAEPFQNQDILSKLSKHYNNISSISKSENPLNSVDFNFTQGMLYGFDSETEVKALAIESTDSNDATIVDFITYVNENDELLDLAIIRKTTIIDGQDHFIMEFYSTEGSLFSSTEVKYGTVINKRVTGTGARSWGECVKVNWMI